MQSIDVLVDDSRVFAPDRRYFCRNYCWRCSWSGLGWLLAKTVRFAVERALRAINFNVLTERAGTDNFLKQAGMRGDTTTLFGLVAYWLVILATLIMAFNGMGLTYIPDLLGRAVLFAPKLIIAMLIMVFGSYCARFVGTAVQNYCLEARIPDAEVLGGLVRYALMLFVVMIA